MHGATDTVRSRPSLGLCGSPPLRCAASGATGSGGPQLIHPRACEELCARERSPQLIRKHSVCLPHDRRFRVNHEVDANNHAPAMPSDRLAEQPFCAVPNIRSLRHFQPRNHGRPRAPHSVLREPNGEVRREDGPPRSGDPFDIALDMEPISFREHIAMLIYEWHTNDTNIRGIRMEHSRHSHRYTAIRFRPFARRRWITLRPFFVRMRRRNPCRRARRRFFGWYVCFGIR